MKNNFQSVQSVIRMQQLPAETQKSLFDRIAAMIAVHEQIYSRYQFAGVSTRYLIPAIVDTLGVRTETASLWIIRSRISASPLTTQRRWHCL
ncbi:two-component sensor histidine kinase [Pararhizobium capsulatum DSM 1112]|uniref:Two-component sensor histidine kinase n=1 Tax=Pararhizobium capsulatum DSM 1112 TaxID=1121113 RepID=A0ABU0BZ80_9HYPH|nr:two-component sensor histidine kinase [Pararhizobium capsulatum DSM 1112]